MHWIHNSLSGYLVHHVRGIMFQVAFIKVVKQVRKHVLCLYERVGSAPEEKEWIVFMAFDILQSIFPFGLFGFELAAKQAGKDY